MTLQYSESVPLLRQVLLVNPFIAKNVCSTTNVLLGPPMTYLLARYDLVNEQYPFEGFPEMVLSLLEVDCTPGVLASSPTVITALSRCVGVWGLGGGGDLAL